MLEAPGLSWLVSSYPIPGRQVFKPDRRSRCSKWVFKGALPRVCTRSDSINNLEYFDELFKMTAHAWALFRIYVVNGFGVVYVYVQFSKDQTKGNFSRELLLLTR